MSRKLECLAIRMFEAGVVQFGEFWFKIHQLAPELKEEVGPANNKIMLRPPFAKKRLIKSVGRAMWLRLKKAGVKFDYAAGLPKAGEPLAEVIAELSGKPLLKIMKRETGEDRQLIAIKGDFRAGQSVLLIDDVITQGGTKWEAICLMREAGLKIAAIVVAVDRQEGGGTYLRKKKYRIICLFTLIQLLKIGLAYGEITKEDFARSKRFSRKIKEKFWHLINVGILKPNI